MERILSMIGIIVAASIILLNRIFEAKTLMIRYKLLFNGIAFLLILLVLAYHFYIRAFIGGLIAVILGGIAFGKFLLDSLRNTEKD